jgi:hypothetical protein
MKSFIKTDELIDEISYLDLGMKDAHDIFHIEHSSLGLSFEDDFEGGNWKIAGFTIFRHPDKILYGRSTYDFLALLGDVGGIYKSSFLLGGLVMRPIASFMVTVFMMPFLFYYRENAKAETIFDHLSIHNALDNEDGQVSPS